MSERKLSEPAMHAYEVRPRSDKRGVDLISDVLPFGRLWYDGPNAASNAIGYAGSTADHMVLWFGFTMKLATWSKRTSTRAISKSGEQKSGPGVSPRVLLTYVSKIQ
jgi:hypothetical protein